MILFVHAEEKKSKDQLSIPALQPHILQLKAVTKLLDRTNILLTRPHCVAIRLFAVAEHKATA